MKVDCDMCYWEAFLYSCADILILNVCIACMFFCLVNFTLWFSVLSLLVPIMSIDCTVCLFEDFFDKVWSLYELYFYVHVDCLVTSLIESPVYHSIYVSQVHCVLFFNICFLIIPNKGPFAKILIHITELQRLRQCYECAAFTSFPATLLGLHFHTVL